MHSQKSFTCEGATGMQRMAELMKMLRTNTPKEIGGLKVICFEDYIASESLNIITGEKTKLTLPKSDVLTFKLEDNASVIIRPSGTEPKIKAYYTTTANTLDDAKALLHKLEESFKNILGF